MLAAPEVTSGRRLRPGCDPRRTRVQATDQQL